MRPHGRRRAALRHSRSSRRLFAVLFSLPLLSAGLALPAATPSIAAQETGVYVLGPWASPAPGQAVSSPPAPPIPVHLDPPPRPGPFSMNLYEAGDFVHQQTKYWCVAAASQTMINIIEDGEPNHSKAFQKRIHMEARHLDERWDPFWERVAGKARWEQGLHGLGIRDWAGILTARGYGPYKVDRAPTRKQAIRMAARAIRLTGRPAGLVVWRGAHSWVMSGFTATADPAYSKDFTVKKVFIQDPWYPSVSSIWGASRPPDSAVSVRALAEDYLPYKRPLRKHPRRDGKYMLILPTLPAGTEARTAW